MNVILKTAIILCCYLLCSASSFANVGEIYGFGSKPSSMGNAFTAIPGGAFGFFYNPGSIVFSDKVTAGIGVTYGASNFNSINRDLILENKKTGDDVRKGKVDLSNEASKGSVFGLTLPLRREFPRIALGGVGYLPLDRVLTIQFEQPYLPIYPLYSKRTQRFSFYGGGAVEVIPNLSLGAGVNLFSRLKGDAVMRATTAEPILVLGINGTPGVSPVAGLQYEQDDYGVGLSYKYEANSTAQVSLKPQLTNIMGADFSLEWLTAGSYFYDPSQLALGFFSKIWASFTLSADLLYQRWSKFQLPYLDVESTGPDLGKSEVRGNFQDIISPKVGVEYQIEKLSLRGGYQFIPSPIKLNQPSNLNLLDANKSIFSLGLGYDFETLFGIVSNPIEVDLHFQYHKLQDRNVVKETEFVGAPGYSIGGSLTNVGFSVTSYF
jgi:hypothetical protein